MTVGKVFLIGEDVMRTLPRGTMLLLLGAALTGCIANNTTTRSTSNKPGEMAKAAPNISGTDGAGKVFRLDDYRGKVVLLDFWADF
jgi:cytochrome oxidase Cu insertion factor (SCO1/SenC/PrrC family)